MRYAELFAGIGGLGSGFGWLGHECVYANEFDKFAAKTYEANYPSAGVKVDRSDIRTVCARDIPDHDLLLAGFPCQSFSKVGLSTRSWLGLPSGMDCEATGKLFYEVARVIEAKRPRAVLLENVKNLLTCDEGRPMSIILGILNHLGYGVSYCVLNAAAWVPQNRRRVFIVALSDNDHCDLSGVFVPARSSWPVVDSALHHSNEPAEPPYTLGSPASVNPKFILSRRSIELLYNSQARKEAKGIRGFSHHIVGPADRASTLCARYGQGGTSPLLRMSCGNLRRFTPREFARLMGFDRPGESRFVIPVSKTQAYRQFGNAVCPPVSSALAPIVVAAMSGNLFVDVFGAVYQR